MIELIKVSKIYSQQVVYDNLNLSIKPGIITTVTGPSGHGKTTLLNIISGIEQPTGGQVNISSKNLGYVLQENVMLPWRTVKENISLSLEVKKNFNGTKERTILDFINRFGLNGFENYYPDTLSGGMKQRAALIRCLITNPDVLLLDEPFSNLDFDIKLKIQKELLIYQTLTKATIIMVTHDIEDAISLSDEVIVLRGKPATIKSKINIEMGLINKDPVLARKSEKFTNYFAMIWDELKYLND